MKPKLELARDPESPPDDGPLASDLPREDMVTAMYFRHRDLVFHLAMRFGGGNRAWAEDVTHDVFLRLIPRVERVNAVENVRGWFYRVTTNVCLTRLRREAFLDLPLVRSIATFRPRTTDLEAIGISNDLLRRIALRLDKMPVKARACFYMHYLDQLPQVEIAQILGHSKGYISKLVARCQRELADLAKETPT